MKIDLARSFVRYLLKDKTIDRSKFDEKSIRKILIMSNTAIGDTLFATPGIRMLKKEYPDKKIILMLNEKNKNLFETNPYVDEFVFYSGKWSGFIGKALELRQKDIDLALIFHSNEPQATPLAYYSKCKYIIKIPNHYNEFNHLHFNERTFPDINEHFIDRRLKQLSFLGIFKKSYSMDIFTRKDWYTLPQKLINKSKINIGLQIGASTRSRKWYTENWLSLIEKLSSNLKTKHKIFLCGSKDDKKESDAICKLTQKEITDTCGLFSLTEAAAFIDSLDILVTPDTGPLHIATALDTPTVCLSVAGSKTESNSPINVDKHVFIQKPKTCKPCLDKNCKDQFCMKQISHSEVFEAIIKILANDRKL